MLQSVLIAIAISIDSLSVGVAYGIKNIKVPLRSLLVLDLISIILLSSGFFAGNLLSKLIPGIFSEVIGASILIGLGFWLLIQGWLDVKYPKHNVKSPTPIAMISIRSLGIAINILRNPFEADLDVSGTIDTKESIFLGIALAVDSLAVGVAVSLSTLSVILFTLFLVGVMNLLFLLFGISIGRKYLTQSLKDKTAFIPGCILMLLGIFRLI